jgi:hypothetical protein
MRKMIIAALAASTALGAVTLAAAPASAQPWGYGGGPAYGWGHHGGWGARPVYGPAPYGYYGPHWRHWHRWHDWRGW